MLYIEGLLQYCNNSSALAMRQIQRLNGIHGLMIIPEADNGSVTRRGIHKTRIYVMFGAVYTHDEIIIWKLRRRMPIKRAGSAELWCFLRDYPEQAIE